MKKLPIKLKQLIKKKRFSLNSMANERDWRGGLDIDYRITMVKSDDEQWYEHLSPLNTEYGHINVNIKVKGSIEMRPRYRHDKSVVEITKATRTRKNYWGGYDTKYDSLWGNQVNKRVRREIKNYLKLMGITSNRTYDGVVIKKINWEV